MKNISNNTIWAGVIGLVVGLILGWFIGHNSLGTKTVSVNNSNSTNSAETQNAASAGTTSGEKSTNALVVNSGSSQESNSAIMVVDQGAGSVATVASVETDASVWVVIREDKNGVFGNILGATRIDAGASNNIVVNLLRPTVAGQTYQVVLFKDDGDKKFDHKIDVPLTSNGTVISKSFKVFAQ